MNTNRFQEAPKQIDWQPAPTTLEQIPYDPNREYPLESTKQTVANAYYQLAHTLPEYRLVEVSPEDTWYWYQYTVEEIAHIVYDFIDANIVHASLAVVLLVLTYLLLSSR